MNSFAKGILAGVAAFAATRAPDFSKAPTVPFPHAVHRGLFALADKAWFPGTWSAYEMSDGPGSDPVPIEGVSLEIEWFSGDVETCELSGFRNLVGNTAQDGSAGLDFPLRARFRRYIDLGKMQCRFRAWVPSEGTIFDARVGMDDSTGALYLELENARNGRTVRLYKVRGPKDFFHASA